MRSDRCGDDCASVLVAIVITDGPKRMWIQHIRMLAHAVRAASACATPPPANGVQCGPPRSTRERKMIRYGRLDVTAAETRR